ncbi:MAG: bifunctional metallophosphatase/5'-nucleotidase [Oscillospiraceae bacterium]|nr:bifunctional metallophosphatase/5'-nucleotidase [Oscillospiraceae bacterium]
MKKTGLLLLMILALLLCLGSTAYAAEGEKSGDAVILFTSDVHCGVDQGFGYAGLQQIRDYLLSRGDDVILVDNGDSIQGEPIGTMTEGEVPLRLMNEMGYALAIPGNHEYDYGMERFLELAKEADFPYISCNFNRMGKLVFDPWTIREVGGRKIGFVGVTTPDTLASSTPRYFQDENGNYIYGFMEDESGEALYSTVQEAVNSAREAGAEYVIVLGHLGNQEAQRPWTYADIISHTNGIDALLDGHSHDTDQVVMKNADGQDVVRSACGTKLNAVGWCRIASDGEVSTGIYTWNNAVSAPAMLGIQNEMSEAVWEAGKALNEKLAEVVATSVVNLTINDPEETDSDGRPIRMVRRAETNLGDFCADAYRDQGRTDIAIVTGGSIRDSIGKGDITLNDILNVHPFGNALTVVEVSGQQILDALEWGCRSLPGESGAFPQVSGLSFEICSDMESGCLTDQNLLFAGVEGERRVKNVLVNGEAIDPEGTYTLASHSYMLLENGDGYTMFDGAKVLQDSVKLDNQLLIDYLRETLGGVIGEEYADPYGQGRITITEGQQ